MAGSVGRKAVRTVVIIVGAFVILAVGLYGPATLVGPLPSAEAAVVSTPAAATATGTPIVPATGASAIVGDATSPVLASGGIAEPVPLGGTVKLITALVVLDAKPLAAGLEGPSIPITQADVDGYNGAVASSARNVPVSMGQSWSQREMLEAMLLGSSNNHADSLARWAFGSIDAYLDAAHAWLAERGLTSITVVDTTGLDEDDVGSASDMARISALTYAEASLAEIMGSDGAVVPGGRSVDNVAAYMDDLGFTGLSRSYTDEAGVCFLFALAVPVAAGDDGSEASSVSIYGAFIREPDWDTLDADLAALASSAATSISLTPVVTAGQAYVTYTTPWGTTVNGVATSTESRMLWGSAALDYTVDAETLATGSAGRRVGTVTVATPDGDVTVPLELDGRIGDPGPLWRLANPVPVITAFIESRFGD